MCGSTCAMLWTRPRDPEPGALPGSAGEKAGSHGGLDAPAAVAAGGSVAGMLGPDLASVGAAPWQECRDAGDDRAGARRFGGGMGPSHSGGGRGIASGSYGCRRGAAYFSYARCGAAPAVCHHPGRRVGPVRASHAGDGRLRSVADRHTGRHPMKSQTESLEHASVRQYCKSVRMPTVGANFVSLAEQAVKENHSHIRYLEALLATECEERDRHAITNRIRDAQLPRMKALEEFDFTQAPQIPAARIRELAEGGYIARSEPVVLIGDCGTGQKPSGDGLVSGRVPTEAAGSIHHGGGSGE